MNDSVNIPYGRKPEYPEETQLRLIALPNCIYDFHVFHYVHIDPVHRGPDLYGHHINLKSLKTSMTLKFVIILQNLIKAYHRKSDKSKYDLKLTELDVETTRIRSRVNGVINTLYTT